MTHLADLSKEDITFICTAITGRYLKQSYQKNSKEFAKIKPGFRPQSITDEEAIALAVHNRDNSFIHFIINRRIDEWLKEIRAHCDALVSEETNRGQALAEALAKSCFCKNIPLYLRLSGDLPSEDCAPVLQYAVDAAQNSQTAETAREDASAREQEELQWESDRQKLLEQLEAKDSALAEVKTSLEAAQGEVLQLQAEVDRWVSLSQHKISTDGILKREDFPYTSLCVVTQDYDGRPWLNRLYDIDEDGIRKEFLPSSPSRTRLYSKSGPTGAGYVGIWDWKVEPNASDPTKDYVTSQFNESYPVVEIVVLEDCASIEDILKKLTSGIREVSNSDRILFAIHSKSKGGYEGVLCERRDLQFSGHMAALGTAITRLPEFIVPDSDVIFVERTRIFCARFDLGLPEQLVPVKDVQLIVKEILLARTTWSVLKQKGMTRSNYRQFYDFLEGLQTDSLFQAVAVACECGEQDAHQLVEQFITMADSYLSGSDFESQTIAQIIRNNPDLMDKCKAEIAAEWESENAEQVAEAKAALQKIADDAEHQRRMLLAAQEAQKSAEEQLQHCQEDLKKHEKLAQDVQQKVATQIQKAQNDAADFIAQQAFLGSPQAQPVIGTVAVPTQTRFSNGRSLPADGLEINHSWRESIETIAVELGEAGVSTQHARVLATILYAAYIHRIPLLLAGPFAHDIADAFSCALFGKTAGILTCNGSLDSLTLNDIIHSDDKIIIVENPYNVEWAYAFDQASGQYPLAVSAYAEELQIEPKGFLNYFIPIMTEILVDRIPDRKFVGGTICDSYTDYKYESKATSPSVGPRFLNINPFANSLLHRLLTTTHDMLSADSTDMDRAIVILSCLYTRGEFLKLRESVDNADFSAEAKRLFQIYCGDDQ